MAKVAVPFRGVPDGESQPRAYAVGDEVSGDLARVAAAEGWLEPELTAAAAASQAAEAAASFIARIRAGLQRAWARLRDLPTHWER